jgi:hypothetical protein
MQKKLCNPIIINWLVSLVLVSKSPIAKLSESVGRAVNALFG